MDVRFRLKVDEAERLGVVSLETNTVPFERVTELIWCVDLDPKPPEPDYREGHEVRHESNVPRESYVRFEAHGLVRADQPDTSLFILFIDLL